MRQPERIRKVLRESSYRKDRRNIKHLVELNVKRVPENQMLK